MAIWDWRAFNSEPPPRWVRVGLRSLYPVLWVGARAALRFLPK